MNIPIANRLPLIGLLLVTFTCETAAAQGDAEQGALLGYTCLGCHGIDGYRNAYPSFRVPRLGGQRAEYLEDALRAYRDGLRPHPTMQAHAGGLSDGDIDNLVAWIESFGAVTDDATAEIVPEAVTACVTCHGAGGADVLPAPPTLAGQHADYLAYALRQYQDNARGNNVMNAFAMTLTDEDLAAAAEFYGSREGLSTLSKD